MPEFAAPADEPRPPNSPDPATPADSALAAEVDSDVAANPARDAVDQSHERVEPVFRFVGPGRQLPQLEPIVALLDSAFEDEKFMLRNRLAQVALPADATDDEFELRLLDLDGDAPVDALLGYNAPEDCIALASIGGGWAAPPGPGDEMTFDAQPVVRPSAHPDAVRARIILVIDRDGRMAGRTTLADGRKIEEPPEGGFVVDALQRALGLPTASPGRPTSDLLTALWLDHVASRGQRVRAEGKRLGWSTVARLHPAVELLRLGGSRPSAAWLVPAAKAMSRVLTWTEVRRQCVERAWLSDWFPPGVAAWMDEGMLARWVLTAMPRPDVALARARGYLLPEADRRLVEALEELATSDGEAA